MTDTPDDPDNKAPETPKKKRGAGGRHFQKGFDPRRNIGGTSKKTKDGISLTVKARGMCEDILDFWWDVKNNPDVPMRERLKASENIYNRGFGAATQTVDITASVKHEHETSTIDFASISQEARMQLLSAVRQLPSPEMIADGEYELVDNDRETDDSDD